MGANEVRADMILMCEALPPSSKGKLHENMLPHHYVFMFWLQSGMVVRASLSRFFSGSMA